MLSYSPQPDKAAAWEYFAAWILNTALVLLWLYVLSDVFFSRATSKLASFLPFQISISGILSSALTVSIYFLFSRLNKIRVLFWLWMSCFFKIIIDVLGYITFKDFTALSFSVAFSLTEGAVFQYLFRHDQQRFLYNYQYGESISYKIGTWLVSYTKLFSTIAWIIILLSFAQIRISVFKP
jgi:hypothetical protein